MKSFKQMRKDGELVRADAEKIDYFSLHIDPDYNPPGRTEEDEADDEELFQFICEKGVLELDDMRVRPRDGGGVWVVQGHRRHKQIGRAIREGKFVADDKGRYLVRIRQFIGNDLDLLYDLVISNKSKKLKPLQFAHCVRRAYHGFGQSVDQIAAGMQCAPGAVRDALTLISANHDVQQMVAAGEVSKTTAVRVVRAKGESAGPVLKDAHYQAQMQGKTRVTSKQVDGNTPRDLVTAIEKEIASGGTFRAETLAPKYAALISYLRSTK